MRKAAFGLPLFLGGAMYILICGLPRSGTKELGEKVKDRLSTRGLPTWFFSALNPLSQLVKAVKRSSEGALANFECFTEDLGGVLCSHGALSKRGFWGETAFKHTSAMTRPFDEAQRPYTCIVSGLPYPEDLEAFPGAFKVWVDCPEESRQFDDGVSLPSGHPAWRAFDLSLDCFDLRLGLTPTSLGDAADLITYQFMKSLSKGLNAPSGASQC